MSLVNFLLQHCAISGQVNHRPLISADQNHSRTSQYEIRGEITYIWGGFRLSVSFYRCCLLISILILLLSEGEAGIALSDTEYNETERYFHVIL